MTHVPALSDNVKQRNRRMVYGLVAVIVAVIVFSFWYFQKYGLNTENIRFH